MRVLLIRGAFLNRYEGQNYEVLFELLKKEGHSFSAIGSCASFHTDFSFSVKKLFSPYDIAVWFRTIPFVGLFFARYYLAFCNRTLGDAHFLFGLESFIKKTGPYDVVFVAETYYGFDVQIARLKKEGYVKKIIATCWEIISHNNESLAMKREIKKKVKKTIDLYVCPTHLAKLALEAEGISSNVITIIRVGVDLSVFKPMLSVKNDETYKVAFIGRKVYEKGLQDFRELSQRFSSKKRYEFIELASIAYQHMPHELSTIDCVVIPSRTTPTWSEQYSMTAVESMAAGKAIIAYDSGALREVIGDAGILVKEGDVEGLSKSLAVLLSNQNRRYDFQKKARNRAERLYDREEIVKKLYDTVLSFMI